MSVANTIAAKVAREHQVTYLRVTPPEYAEAWADDFHLSDWGLQCWLYDLERILEPILLGYEAKSDDFPPLHSAECRSDGKIASKVL